MAGEKHKTMKMTHNTVLITGGTSGIGLELAAQLLDRDNIVIVTGRDQSGLEAARRKLPGLIAFRSDVSDPTEVAALFKTITTQYPALNILINNAGIMRKVNLTRTADLAGLTREIDINLKGPIWMVSQFLPHLKRQKSAAIVNVSSGLAFVPMAISPIYSASKAALHAYTRSLRVQLKHTAITVFELAPPGTETPLFHGDFSDRDVSGVKPMSVRTLVRQAIAGIEGDRLTTRPSLSNVLYVLSRLVPELIFNRLGKTVDSMLSEPAKPWMRVRGRRYASVSVRCPRLYLPGVPDLRGPAPSELISCVSAMGSVFTFSPVLRTDSN